MSLQPGFLVKDFPVQNGKPLSLANWTKYCVWIGFDDDFIKSNYKVYLRALKKYKGSREIRRYSVNTKNME